jgi:uroporphyrinogen-III decarboxylase
VIDSVKKTHPSLPIILYISGSGGLLERMAAANPDIISIDQSVDIVDGIKRVGSGFAIQVGGPLQLSCAATKPQQPQQQKFLDSTAASVGSLVLEIFSARVV